jgi:hypothetical protein
LQPAERKEGNMPRTLSFITACLLALVFCAPGHAQDSPSLGDLARQAQKDKAKDPAAKRVITNDDLPSSSGSSGIVPGLGRVVQPGTPGKPAPVASPPEELQRMESALNELDSLDGATLAKNILQGSGADFPGRSKWEEKLFAAKQAFVSQERALMKKADQVEASAKGIQDAENPNDPRARDLANRLQQLVQQSAQLSAAFQTVITEGKELAGQSTGQ